MRIQEHILPTLISKGIVTIDNIVIGAKVKRGPDWAWGDQDAGGEGVLIKEVDGYLGWVEVDWGGVCEFTYRIGYENKYDLEYV